MNRGRPNREFACRWFLIIVRVVAVPDFLPAGDLDQIVGGAVDRIRRGIEQGGRLLAVLHVVESDLAGAIKDEARRLGARVVDRQHRHATVATQVAIRAIRQTRPDLPEGVVLDDVHVSRAGLKIKVVVAAHACVVFHEAGDIDPGAISRRIASRHFGKEVSVIDVGRAIDVDSHQLVSACVGTAFRGAQCFAAHSTAGVGPAPLNAVATCEHGGVAVDV
jgi:hypothetical protein